MPAPSLFSGFDASVRRATAAYFLYIIKDVLNIDIEDDKYIGEEYGIYVIKDVLPNKDKWNHKIYKGVCKQCGYERFGTINDFKGKMISNCTHIRLLSDEHLELLCPNCHSLTHTYKSANIGNGRQDRKKYYIK